MYYIGNWPSFLLEEGTAAPFRIRKHQQLIGLGREKAEVDWSAEIEVTNEGNWVVTQNLGSHDATFLGGEGKGTRVCEENLLHFSLGTLPLPHQLEIRNS